MNMGSKDTGFSLSKEEKSLLEDVTFFQLKRDLTGHITLLFRKIEENLGQNVEEYRSRLPENALLKQGKISKGENYLGLPYMVLDYPAVFEKDGVFAFRTMMWWGNPFTITFHVSGKFLEKINPGFSPEMSKLDLLVCINDNQWVHHTGKLNFIPYSEFIQEHSDWKKYADQKGFLKAAIQIPINESDNLQTQTINFFKTIMNEVQ